MPMNSRTPLATVTRVGAALVIALLAAAALLDPYTLHLNAGDVLLPAPPWQALLGLGDVALLLVTAGLAWGGKTLRASAALGFETVFNLTVNVALVMRDGLTRFLHGFGAQEYLSIYLCAVALKVVVVVVLQQHGIGTLGREEHGQR